MRQYGLCYFASTELEEAIAHVTNSNMFMRDIHKGLHYSVRVLTLSWCQDGTISVDAIYGFSSELLIAIQAKNIETLREKVAARLEG
jgi:diketogulonate reductase-like aldo/keto reductase